MNKEHKNIVGIVVLAVAILLLVGLLLWNTLKNDDEMSIDTYEAQQLELFSAAVYEDLEAAKGMEYAEAQDYIITSLNENRRTYSSDSVDLASLKMLNLTTDDISNSTSSLLDELGSMLDGFDIGNLLGGLFGENNGSSMRTLTMKSNTVCQAVADQKYCVDKLSANVYITDVNSNKWAVLLHGMMMSGSLIYNSIGSMYEAQGYNIIAPDLRGFGDSDGSVALGCLESLDVYDWLNVLNDKYNADQIIVHGVSLGAATTNFLSGIDQFMANGPTKIGALKSLRELKVIGLVEDCGYTDMEDFANETFLLMLNIGLTKDNFDYYSKATNSLKYCDLPMLVIHGTMDTTVKPENADRVKNAVNGPVDQWKVSGGVHAFVIMGMNKDDYKEHVQDFIDKYESQMTTPITPVVPEVAPEQNLSLIQSLVKALKSILGLLDILKI